MARHPVCSTYRRASEKEKVEMIKVTGATLIISAFLIFAADTQATPWRGVIPTRSGKAAVRARLGKPTFESQDRMEFEDRLGKSVVFFYTAQDTTDLNISPELAGKVLTIYFYPRKPAVFDRSKLAHKVVAVGHGVTDEGELMTSYDDGEHGISYHFKKDETRVWRIVYYAPRSEFAKFKTAQSDNN
jgi:hypothetical protein